jgi:CRISPR-associated protein Cas1
MSILALTKQHLEVKKTSKRLYLYEEGNRISELRVEDLDAILNFGNIHYSPQALSLIANSGVTISFLSVEGKFKGQFMPYLNKNANLHFLQYETFNNEERTLWLQKFFVLGKAISILSFINNISKNHYSKSLPKIKSKIKDYTNKIEKAKSYESLLGYEGAISKLHFSFYAECFTSELQFVKRTKRPPENEVNALLSLFYTLLFQLINSMLCSVGLDPYIGFLHKEAYGRPSLALDVLELFRASVADRTVLSLINKKIISKKHFQEKDFRLTNKGLEKTLKKFKSFVYDPRPSGNLTLKITKVLEALIKYFKFNTPISISEKDICI